MRTLLYLELKIRIKICNALVAGGIDFGVYI
jgi:hypothetical protein